MLNYTKENILHVLKEQKPSHTTAYVLGTKIFNIFLKHPRSSGKVKIKATNVDNLFIRAFVDLVYNSLSKMKQYFSLIYYLK